MVTRRFILKGLLLAPVAPAVVKAANIMPVKPIYPSLIWRTPFAPEMTATEVLMRRAEYEEIFRLCHDFHLQRYYNEIFERLSRDNQLLLEIKNPR